MKLIALGGRVGKGKFAKVDNEDFELVSGMNWHLQVTHGTEYAMGHVGRRSMQMGRFILGDRHGFMADHANGDGLDNQRNNLRWATHSENQRNQKKRINVGMKSKLKGCNKTRYGWSCLIQWKEETVYLGHFKDEHLAGLMYDFWQVRQYGKFAKTNFKVVGWG